MGTIPKHLTMQDLRSQSTDLVLKSSRNSRHFGDLYLLHVERIFAYTYSWVRNAAEAEDITSQTFLKAFESLHTLRNKEQFSAWLITIARNLVLDHYRKSASLTDIDLEVLPTSEKDPLSLVLQNDEITNLSEALYALPQEELELLRLRFVAQLTFAEIASLLNKSEGAVKKQTYRLLALLQQKMEDSRG